MGKVRIAKIEDFQGAKIMNTYLYLDSCNLSEYDNTSLVQCPDCNEFSPVSDWRLIEDACNCPACGRHDGLICPRCCEVLDIIHAHFKIKDNG